MERRTALGLMASVPFIPNMAAAAAGSENTALDPADPDDLHLIHRKITSTYDDRPVFWYLETVRYGLVDTVFTPFWNVHVGFLSKVKSTGEFETETKTLNAIFYSDLETGSLLETFKNPYTGASTPIKQPGLRRGGPRPSGKTAPTRESSREEKGARVTQAGDITVRIIGDDVWVRGNSFYRSEPTGSEGQLVQVYDWSTYHASLSEVADPSVTSARATEDFFDVLTWPAWLNMGDHPGNYVSRGVGRKSHSPEGMPPQWLRFMKELYPAESRDLVAAIDG